MRALAKQMQDEGTITRVRGYGRVCVWGGRGCRHMA